MATIADAVADSLAEAGIEYIFGVPGSLSSVELIEAASKRNIRYILCSNEASAAVMAGTYGVLRCRPGVVSTGVGPGAVAAVSGVAQCYLERAPLLVLTDRYTDLDFSRLARQRLDHNGLFRPVTKATLTLNASSPRETIREALALAMTGRPGPVHIDLPYDAMQTEIAAEAAANRTPALMDQPSPAAGIAALLDAITSSRAPAVIVGSQVNRRGQGAEAAFVRFAQRLGAPVFASLSAKGTLPEQHPLAMGLFRGAPFEHELLDSADLLIVVGFDPVEIFAPGLWPYKQRTILLDEIAHTDGVIPAQIALAAGLESSLDALAESTPSRNWDLDALNAYKLRRRAPLLVQGDGLMPGAVVRIARDRLPDNGIMTVDAGQHKFLACDTWQTRRPCGLLTSSGLGSMAVSIPAAIAAKLVERDTPVICLVGDGGFLMRVGDLETAVRERLSIVIVVFNDRWLNLIKLQQDRRGYSRLGTGFAECDFAATARSFGFEGFTVHTEGELDAALAQAFACGLPCLIDARINPDGYR